MRSSDLKMGSHLTLSQTSSLSPLLEFSRRGNDSRSAVGAMRQSDSAAGLHTHASNARNLKAKGQPSLIWPSAELATCLNFPRSVSYFRQYRRRNRKETKETIADTIVSMPATIRRSVKKLQRLRGVRNFEQRQAVDARWLTRGAQLSKRCYFSGSPDLPFALPRIRF